MKTRFILSAVLTFVLTLTSVSTARADDPHLIEVGAGVGTDPNGSVDLVFRVEFNGGIELVGDNHGGGVYLFVARVNGEGALNAQDGLSYMDFNFEYLRLQAGSNPETFAGIVLLSSRFQKDIALNNMETARVSLLGLRAGYGGTISEGVLDAYVQGAVDFLGMGLTRRMSDGASLDSDASTGTSWEAGLKFFQKYRLTVGQKYEFVGGKPETVYTGMMCYRTDNYGHTEQDPFPYDPSRGGYVYCQDTYGSHYRDARSYSQSYIQFAADFSEHMSLFFKGSYNVYSVTDETGAIPNSNDEGWRLVLGVNYRM